MTTIKTYSKIQHLQTICEELQITIFNNGEYLYLITELGLGEYIGDGFDNVEEAYGFIKGYQEAVNSFKVTK